MLYLICLSIILSTFNFFTIVWCSCPSANISKYSHDWDEVKSKQTINWAIVCLVPAGEHESWATKRNELLVRYLKYFSSNDRFNITILMFSEWDLRNNDGNMIWKDMFKGIANYELVDTRHLGYHALHRQGKIKTPYGYPYMCKFFMLDLFDLLYERNIDYYWRIDADGFLMVLGYDIFDWVVSHNIEYGYLIKEMEYHQDTVATLVPYVTDYVHNCSIIPSALLDVELTHPLHFYNNFHIAKVSFFLRSDVQQFLHAINNTGNVYKHRWGDSAVQGYAVRLFMNASRIQFIPGVEYIHGTHRTYLEAGVRYSKRGVIFDTLRLNVSNMAWPNPYV